MGYMYGIEINNDTYLIEPRLYAVGSGTSQAITANITHFELISGSYIFLKPSIANDAQATLQINAGAVKNIYYNDAPIEANLMKENHIYVLLYDGTQWNLVDSVGSGGGGSISNTIGNINLDGTLQTTDVTIGVNDQLVITDASDSNKIARSSIIFDGITANKALTQKGTWELFNNYEHPTTEGYKHIPAGGREGQILAWDDDGTAKWINASTEDTKVTQSSSIDDGEYSILLKHTDNTRDETAGANYNDSVYVNPSTGALYASSFHGTINAEDITAGEIDDSRIPTITNDKLENDYITIAGNDVELGESLSAATLRESLGLSNALHLIGQATVDAANSSFPSISGYSNPQDGDVILARDGLREYVFIDNEWILLGFTASTIYDSDTITAVQNDIPTWISNITQATDGRITVERETLSILPVNHGGTGADNFTTNQVILSGNPSFTSRAYIDNTFAEALTTSNNFITERSVYYGLPNINNHHDYDSTSHLYAPITPGSEYQILISGAKTVNNILVTEPQWTPAAFLESHTSSVLDQSALTILTLGNSSTLTQNDHSEGRIELYSNNSGSHIIQGASITNNRSHTLVDNDGYLMQTDESSLTSNRIYYSASSTIFSASGHYISNTQLGINITSWPASNNDVLYVEGNTTINGDLNILSDLTITNTTTFGANVGIGGDPDTSSNDNHILSIVGSVLISGQYNPTAHLDVLTTNSNTDYLIFIPEITGTGAIGLDSAQWESASFSSHINVGTNLIGASIQSSGNLILMNDTASILLETENNNNEVGILTITAEVPSIYLTSTITNHIDWAIINNGTDLLISNQETDLVQIDGSENGFEITGNVGINTQPEILGANDSHVLTIKGDISIINAQNALGYIEQVTVNNISSLQYYPETDESGYIGLASNRWLAGYFSSLLEIGARVGNNLTGVSLNSNGTVTISNNSSSINLSTTPANNLDVGQIEIISSDNSIWLYAADNASFISIDGEVPELILNTTTNNSSDWILNNDNGQFNLNNQRQAALVELQGHDTGFYISPRLYINEEVANSNYSFYVNGNSYLYGNLTIEGSSYYEGNLLPIDNDTHSLGEPGDPTNHINPARWKALYIGDSNTYGDSYLPIYWNNGVPDYLAGVVQIMNFTIAANTTQTILQNTAYNQLYGIETYVLGIVVTSGESYLCGPINWTSSQVTGSSTQGQIILSTELVSGNVTGYILTARGCLLINQYNNNSTPGPGPTPDPDPGSDPEPESEPENNEGNG